MKKVLLDAHTHTVASGHAYSSLQEMAKAAADMGLEVLGITEHGPSVPGTCPTLYFKNMFVVPRRMYGIRLLMGCEINILDTKGRGIRNHRTWAKCTRHLSDAVFQEYVCGASADVRHTVADGLRDQYPRYER